MTRWRWTRRTILVVALAVPCSPFILMVFDVYNSRCERHRLLHETDHQALLAASRKLMQQATAEESIDQPAQDPRVPLLIRELGPSSITISPHQVRAELHGGFAHYGFIAFNDTASEGAPRWTKLIDGLFYYED